MDAPDLGGKFVDLLTEEVFCVVVDVAVADLVAPWFLLEWTRQRLT